MLSARPASTVRAAVLGRAPVVSKDAQAALIAIAVGVITVLTWPARSPRPEPGLDPSWQAGLQMGFHDGLHYGSDLLFTYGPLGFLEVPQVWVAGPGAAAIVFLGAQQALVVAALVVALRRTFGVLLALLAAFVVAGLAPAPALPAVAFMGAVAVVEARGDAAPARQRWLLGAIAVLGSLELLVKINSGALVLALGGLAALIVPARARLAPLYTVLAMVVYFAGWAIAGQSFADLPRYVSGSLDVISGYADAMQYESSDARWQYVPALVVVVLGGVLIGTRRAPRSAPTAGLLALWLVLCFGAFKAGFIRLDASHSPIFFGWALIGLCALAASARDRAIAAVSIAFGAVVVAGLAPTQTFGTFAPAQRLSEARASLVAVVRPSNRRLLTSDGRAVVARETDVPSALLEEARRLGPTTVWPLELSVVWAARLDFRPLPLWQDYLAYTPRLDRRNAEALADDSRAPRTILLDGKEGVVDGRLRSFNAPEAMQEMLCRYRGRTAGSDRWILLVRGRSRCTRPATALTHVDVPAGRTVPVPAPSSPDAYVTARIDGVGGGLLQRARSALFRGPFVYLLGPRGRHRLVPALASEGAIVRAGRDADFARPHQVAPYLTRLGVAGAGDVRISFYERRMER